MKLSSIVIVDLDQRYHMTPTLLKQWIRDVFTESRTFFPQKYQDILIQGRPLLTVKQYLHPQALFICF